MIRPAGASIAAWLVLCSSLPGCNAAPETVRLRDELADARARAEKLERDNADLRTELRRLREQVEALQALGEKRLEKLYTVERIELGRHTGGIDLDDNRADHEGVKVFLQPVDIRGDVLKAAGSATVQLYDLAAAEADNLVAERSWTVEELAEAWSSGFLAYHYSLECPWGDEPPTHDEVTVRVKFTEYLTGRTFTAQTVCTVRPPRAE